GFPISVQCADIILSYRAYFNPESKEIIDIYGEIIAWQDFNAICTALRIPM
ncbi:hypothetical protein KI387_028724, partial [Taxus chinensis]